MRLDVIFSATATGFFGAIFLLLAFESWALLTGQRPISDYVHDTVRAYPGWAFAISIVLGMLLGHFLWGPARGATSPSGDCG